MLHAAALLDGSINGRAHLRIRQRIQLDGYLVNIA